jgi:hypothetical protein
MGEADFLRGVLAGEGAVYCFRGEPEMKTVFAAGLRFRDWERIDEVGLDERPLLDFKGDGLGLIRSSHASSSDVVESCISNLSQMLCIHLLEVVNKLPF